MTSELDDVLEIRGSSEAQPAPETDVPNVQLDELQRVSNYRLVRKTLIGAGIGSIVFGVIAIAMGFTLMEDSPINVVLGVIGILLLVEGIAIALFPRPGGMIIDGIALLILGLWNILVTFENVSGGGTPMFAVLGVWQIIWGCQSFGRYGRFAKMPVSKPSKETVKIVDEIVKGMVKAQVKDTADMISFQAKQPWKAKLSPDSAVFIEGVGQDVVFARKDQVAFDRQGETVIAKAIKARFQMGDRNVKGTISPEHFERYEAWKDGDREPTDTVESNRE